MNDYYTYLLIDPRNNKPFYVGKGCKYRMTKHERLVRMGKIPNKNMFLFNKINKIIKLGFSIKYKKPIKNVSADTAFRWEVKFIECLKSKGYTLCNMSSGGIATRGNLGKKHSDETKLKWKEKRKGMFTLQWFIDIYGANGIKLYNDRSLLLSNSRKGIKPPPITNETRNKLIQSHLGKKQSPETILKRSIAMKGKGLGRVLSDETRYKISISRKGRPSSMLGKTHSLSSKIKMKQSHIKNYSFLSPDKDIINISCLKDFCKENKLNYGNMSSVATGHRKKCQGWSLVI